MKNKYSELIKWIHYITFTNVIQLCEITTLTASSLSDKKRSVTAVGHSCSHWLVAWVQLTIGPHITPGFLKIRVSPAFTRGDITSNAVSFPNLKCVVILNCNVFHDNAQPDRAERWCGANVSHWREYMTCAVAEVFLLLLLSWVSTLLTQVWLILLIEWAIFGVAFEIIDRFKACQKYRLQPNAVISNETKIRFGLHLEKLNTKKPVLPILCLSTFNHAVR